MIKAVLFDFDGTIFDTNKLIVESWNEVFRVMTGKEGDEAKIKATFGEPLLITMEKWFPGESERLVEIYRNHQKDIYFKMIETCEGMPELIKKLKALGYMNAVVTSRLKRSTINTLEKFDLKKYFDVIVTCDDTEKHKPDPEPALVALNKLGISAEEAIMIGDSHFDILCAQNAGVKAVLVGWSEAAGVTHGNEEYDYTPDFIIEKPDDLIDIIRQAEI